MTHPAPRPDPNSLVALVAMVAVLGGVLAAAVVAALTGGSP